MTNEEFQKQVTELLKRKSETSNALLHAYNEGIRDMAGLVRMYISGNSVNTDNPWIKTSEQSPDNERDVIGLWLLTTPIVCTCWHMEPRWYYHILQEGPRAAPRPPDYWRERDTMELPEGLK